MNAHRIAIAPYTVLLLALSGCSSSDSAPSLLSEDSVYPSSDWETAEPAQLGFDPKALDDLARAADANDSHCLLVTRKGRIVGEWYWDGWDEQSQMQVFSVTKSITSALVGIAQDEGFLDVNQPAADFIEEWQGTDSADVSIKNLLSNDSGRTWTFFGDYVSMAGTAADKTQFSIDLGQDHAPGTYWEYNNSAIQTLERVLVQATGETDIAAYAKKKLFDPIGMGASMSHDAAGNTEMFEGLKASCRDLARFGYLYLRGGTWEGGAQVVSKAWVDASTHTSQPLNVDYGYLWWLNEEGHYVLPSAPARQEGDGKLVANLPSTTFNALGLGGQVIVVDPEHEMVVTRIGGSDSPLSAVSGGADLAGTSVVTELGNMLGAAILE